MPTTSTTTKLLTSLGAIADDLDDGEGGKVRIESMDSAVDYVSTWQEAENKVQAALHTLHSLSGIAGKRGQETGQGVWLVRHRVR